MKKDFLLCGLTGWCMEIVFTALDSYRKRELQLMGKTSLWMFPIYGMASFLKPFCRIFKNFPTAIRAFLYSILIFIGEYVSGSILKKYKICPWDYSKAPTNIRGIVRLDFAPFWMVAGLLFENLLVKSKR